MTMEEDRGDRPEGGREAYEEGPVAKKIERRTAKLPSDLFLWVAGGAVALSLAAQIIQPRSRFGMPTRMGQLGIFVGEWVPSILLLGVYNKIVKVLGRSDRMDELIH